MNCLQCQAGAGEAGRPVGARLQSEPEHGRLHRRDGPAQRLTLHGRRRTENREINKGKFYLLITDEVGFSFLFFSFFVSFFFFFFFFFFSFGHMWT